MEVKNEKRENWRRTGKTIQEISFNKGGVITLAEEINSKGHKRLVAIEYTTISKKVEEQL